MVKSTSIVLQSDGRILIGGPFDQVNANSRRGVARLNADGTLDSSFVPPSATGIFSPDIHALALREDGKIYAGGFVL